MKVNSHAIVELADCAAGAVDHALTGLRAISGVEAYRRYNWIRDIRPLNSALNHRGMVISSRWAAVYDFSKEWGETAGRVAVVATLATNIYRAKNEIDAIWKSNDDENIKYARLSTQVSSIALRTVGSVVPEGAHAIASSLGWCMGLADHRGLHQAANWRRSLDAMDVNVRSTFDKVTDGNNIFAVVQQSVQWWSSR